MFCRTLSGTAEEETKIPGAAGSCKPQARPFGAPPADENAGVLAKRPRNEKANPGGSAGKGEANRFPASFCTHPPILSRPRISPALQV